MAAQKDFVAGFDLASVSQPTKAQLMALVNAGYPLPNIGFFISQPTTPDVAGNPRFARYIWEDTSTDPSTLKIYTRGAGTWGALPVSTGGVIEASIADGSVTFDTKIGGFVLADAGKRLKVNAAGTRLELVAWNSDELPTINLDKLTSVGGGAGYFLKWNAAGTALVYEAYNPSVSIAANTIELVKLINGSAAQLGFILRANPATGVIELVSNNDVTSNFLALNGITANKLSNSGGVVTQYGLRYNTAGSVWEFAKVIHQSADTVIAAATAVIVGEAHGLGGMPNKLDMYLVNKADNAGLGYTVGDIIPVSLVRSNNAGSVHESIFAPKMIAASYSVGCSFGAGWTFAIPTSAGTGVTTGITRANFVADWNLRVILTRFSN